MFSYEQMLGHEKLPTLSTEMIDIQLNDYIVPALSESISSIREILIKSGTVSTVELYNKRDVKPILQKIEGIIVKRFGINIKIIGNNYFYAGILTAPPLNNNNLNSKIETGYNDVLTWLRTINKNKDNSLDSSEIKTFDGDYEDVYFNWTESMASIEKSLNTTGIVIDRKRATITGLTSDYVLFLDLDIVNLINTCKLTDKELVAILLHEIGHSFNDIEYSSKIISNTSFILDGIQENVLKKNKSFKESLLLVYKTTYDEVPTTLKDKNTNVVFLSLVERYLLDITSYNDSLRNSSDSEQLADQFSGRFGLGSELVSALDKMDKVFKSYESTVLPLLIIICFYFIMVLIMTGSVLATGFIIAVATILTSIAYLFGSIIKSYETGGNIANYKTYDSIIERYKRIRYDMIRQLRNSNIDEKYLKNMIHNITYIDNIIDGLPIEKTPMVDKFMQTYTARGKRIFELERIEQLVEELMENDLYVQASKFKTL